MLASPGATAGYLKAWQHLAIHLQQEFRLGPVQHHAGRLLHVLVQAVAPAVGQGLPSSRVSL
jgi:hypothetical protein